MNERDSNSSAIGRRELLQAFTLLSLGGLIFGFSEAVARPVVIKSEYVVIDGWVLPAQHFRPAHA
jgi:hypothetical protein